MKKNPGFTRFEFYFVISAISIITLVALQRYLALVEETKRFSFEINARNFSTAIYNHHVRWILAHQNQNELSVLNVDGTDIQFSTAGWPVAVLADKNLVNEISITSCLDLWQHFLQTPPLISTSDTNKGSHEYHLSLHNKDTCRYELTNLTKNKFFADYKPASGDFVLHTQPLISK